jgi:hypothetical protein
MVEGIILRFKSTTGAIFRLAQETCAARLAGMIRKLWPDLSLLAILVFILLVSCFVLAGLTARNVFETLSPSSSSGIVAVVVAVIVAVLAAVFILELCAASAVAGMNTALQLASDAGRHHMHALLTLASAVAVLIAALALSTGEDISILGVAAGAFAAAGLCALTIWFQRVYRSPSYPGFRDFRVDVVDARQFLTRASHGE